MHTDVDESIHSRKLPEIEEDYTVYSKYTQLILNFNSMVWNKKKSYVSPETGKPLSLKDPIELSIPENLLLFEKDLIMMHNIKGKWLSPNPKASVTEIEPLDRL